MSPACLICCVSQDNRGEAMQPIRRCTGFGITGPGLKVLFLGHLAGSVSRARDSRSWGREFEPQVGCREDLKSLREKKKSYFGHFLWDPGQVP